MIMWRMKEFLEGGGELLRAEAELASKRFRRVLVGSALVLLAGVMALAGIFTILAGVAVLIAQHLGWSAALMIVGAGVTGLCMVGWLIAYLTGDGPGSIEEPLFPETQSAKHQASRAKEKMTDAATPGSGSSRPSGDAESRSPGSFPSSIEELKENAVAFTARNPVLVASGAMLAFSVIGPGKTLRMVSRAAATAGLVGTLIDSLSADPEHSDHKTPAPNSATPTAARGKGEPGTDAAARSPRPSASERASGAAPARSHTEALRGRVNTARGKGVSEQAPAM